MAKKILHVAPSRLTRGGITAVVQAYSSTDFWATNSCDWIETYIDRSSIWKIYYFIRSLMEFAFRVPFCRLAHIHLSEPTGAMRKSCFAVLAFLWRKPVVLHFHAFSPDTTIFGPKRHIYRYLFCRANAVIVLSESWKDSVQQAFPILKKVLVIPNPCIDVRQRENNISEGARKYLLFAGTLNQRKGYADLIEAFSQVAASHSDWDLVFAGNGELDKANQLARDLGIEDRVLMPGWVSAEKKDRLFRQASGFCLPSYAEGFPMAILDAFAYGLPVIATPVGGIPDILTDGENALLVEPGNIKTLALALDQLFGDSELRQKLATYSRLLAESTFSIKKITILIERVYLEVC